MTKERYVSLKISISIRKSRSLTIYRIKHMSFRLTRTKFQQSVLFRRVSLLDRLLDSLPYGWRPLRSTPKKKLRMAMIHFSTPYEFGTQKKWKTFTVLTSSQEAITYVFRSPIMILHLSIYLWHFHSPKNHLINLLWCATKSRSIAQLS